MQRHVKPSIRKLVIERDQKCVYCGRPVVTIVKDDVSYTKRWKAYDENGNVFHFEHPVPLADGGANDETNIVLSCSRCNLAKARKEATDRAIQRGGAMTRVIKVSDEVYGRLDKLRQPGESFNDAVVRALDVYDTIKTVSDTLGPDHYLRKPPERLIRAQEAAH